MKRSITLLLALLLPLGLLGACGGDDDKNSADADGDANPSAAVDADTSVKVTIGAQDFGESRILAEIYKQALAEKGYTTSIHELGGNRATELTAFEQKTINFVPEYAASMLEFVNNKKGEATGDATATYEKLNTYLADKQLKAFRPSSAVDTNAFVVTKKTSDDLGIKTLSDLADKGKNLKIGAPADCETNPFCIPGLKSTYGLDLAKNYTALEPGPPIIAALDAGSIQIALLFSTDGTIKSKGYVLLEDDKHMLAADNVLPVVSKELSDAKGFESAVNAITAKLTTDKLIDMNKRFDIDKEDAAVIAKDFLTDEGLL